MCRGRRRAGAGGCPTGAVGQSRGPTFLRTAGIAKEKVARGNLLQILTAGDDVEDQDEDIGDAEAIDASDP